MKKTKKRLLLALAAVLLLQLILFFATKAVYDNTFSRYDPAVSPPASARKMEFQSGENTLCGWYFAAEDPEGLVIWSSGYHACAGDYLPQIGYLTDHGWSVFAYDATGNCASGGDSGVGFCQQVLDLDAALDFTAEQKDFGCPCKVLFGHSQGGYAACCVLDRRQDVEAVVSVSGLNSAMEAVTEPAEQRVGFLAYAGVPCLWLYQTMLFGSELTDLEACAVLDEQSVPALIIQGSEDAQADVDGASIYAHRDHIDAGHVEYLLLSEPEQNGHTDLLFNGTAANEDLMRRILEFYESNTTAADD